MPLWRNWMMPARVATPTLRSMTELSPRPDRFGCLSVATVLWMGLFGILVLILAIIAGDDLGASLQNWINQQQNQAPNGPGDAADPNGDNIPQISNRWYSSGSASTTVGGGPFVLNGPIQIDTHASYTQDGLSWISFIDNSNPDAGEILIALGEPENTVTVAHGNTSVIIGTDDECKFDIKVTDGSVSGTVKCARADVMTGFPSVPSGETAAIDLQFSTSTTPMDDGSGGGDEGGGVVGVDTPDPDQ